MIQPLQSKVTPGYRCGYRCGDNLDFYIQNKNNVCWGITMELIRDDLGGNPSEEDCEEELRRLCEPSVRHYFDCFCALCR